MRYGEELAWAGWRRHQQTARRVTAANALGTTQPEDTPCLTPGVLEPHPRRGAAARGRSGARSPRSLAPELAWRLTDIEETYISESSVYRSLDRGTTRIYVVRALGSWARDRDQRVRSQADQGPQRTTCPSDTARESEPSELFVVRAFGTLRGSSLWTLPSRRPAG